jgi:adenylylsulfate kinase
MGLPGAGKTTLAKLLADKIDAVWFNADDVRRQYEDWDFSHAGRIRQSERMCDLADTSDAKFVIADFVAPLKEMRDKYAANWTIWVDTISESRYADTNSMFVKPDVYDFRVTEKDAEKWATLIAEQIKKE